MIPTRPLLSMLAVLLATAAGTAPSRAPGQESIEAQDGTIVDGVLTGDPKTGFRFRPRAGGTGTPLSAIRVVRFTPTATTNAPAPPVQVDLGIIGQISGSLAALDEKSLRLTDGPGGTTLQLDRSGVQGIRQRPGEAQVLAETFDTLRESVWAQVGAPAVTPDGRAPGETSLQLPAGATAITHRLSDPLWSGRLRLAFFDDGQTHPGQRWFVDLTFRGADGLETVQVLPGWEQGTLGVRSRGNGPALAVQPLARTAGWHVLTARFGPEGTDIAVDGDELAHGDAPGGPLVELRVATESRARRDPEPGLAARVADLRLVRLTTPTGPPEIDVTQDEIRLLTGDQLFGHIPNADRSTVTLRIAGETTTLPWSEIAGLYLQRNPNARADAPLSGHWVRLTWQPPGTSATDDENRVEGVLDAVDDAAIHLRVPYVGALQVPRAQAVELRPLGIAARQVLDTMSHHLGNAFVSDLDPPQPEGASWSLSFPVDDPARFDHLAFDVVQLVGVEGNLDFSPRVRDGELLTRVFVNGREVDNLNRHVTSRNDTTVRVRIALAPGTLKAGPNTLRLTLAGLASDPDTLDNFGLLGVALEGPTADREGPRP